MRTNEKISSTPIAVWSKIWTRLAEFISNVDKHDVSMASSLLF